MIVPVGEAGDGEERERQSGASFTWSDWDDLSSHIHDLQLQEVEQELNIIAREMDQEMNIFAWEMGWRTRTRNVEGQDKEQKELRAGA
eukprot:s4707_g8.t1